MPKNKNSELVDLLRKNFDWQFAWFRFFEKIICPLIMAQTVCYSILGETFEGDVNSNTKVDIIREN